jgi:WS/DGAT/MGAT family acyltransferase
MGRRWLRRGLRLAAHPSRLLDMADTGRQAATVLRRLALTGTEPHTAFRGKLGITKRAAWSQDVSLDSVKLVGRRLGGTVNDVLLAAVSGALRRYLLARGEEVEDVEIHVAIPVNLRQPGTEAALGNQVGAFLLLLPVCLAGPAERLAVIRRRMDRHKNSLEAPVILTGLKVFGALPAGVETPLVDYFSSKLTAVVTNVVGPSERLYLAGAPVESFMFWVPKTGRVGLGVSFLSYAGQVRLGVISDAGLVPDPEAIVAGFHAEFNALLALAQEAGEKPSLRASLSLLDDATATLDALLDSRLEEQGAPTDDR